jgi:hypothetical protein
VSHGRANAAAARQGILIHEAGACLESRSVEVEFIDLVLKDVVPEHPPVEQFWLLVRSQDGDRVVVLFESLERLCGSAEDSGQHLGRKLT